VFETAKLAEITADDIELYLRRRLKQRVTVKTKNGFVEKGVLKATTVHQELRVLRRMLNVAVRKKLLFANPCAGVEFPARVDGFFRPHYVTWSEQQKIEFSAPEYLRNVIRIITETGLRVYKELTPMKKAQLDLENRVVWIPDSKTVNGVAEVPLTEVAIAALQSQLVISGPSPYLFPSDQGEVGHQTTFKTVWRLTLKRAGVPYFRIYDLRSTYATRLSAGGVADEWVTQLLRQGDAKVFKKYSQMKLQMKREALTKLNRRANEGGLGFGFWHSLGHSCRNGKRKRWSASEQLVSNHEGFGRRGWTRTSDHLLRRQVLYPPELRARSMSYGTFRSLFFADFGGFFGDPN
jgi:integrase